MDFLKETDFTPAEAAKVFALAQEYAVKRGSPKHREVLAGQSWGMLFAKSSTRTRVSFEVGLRELGAHAVYLETRAMQMSRGETPEDTAKVLSGYLHGLIIRTFDHAELEIFASAGNVPVVNALTDFLHPCQLYTDLFTIAQQRNAVSPTPEQVKGLKVAFLGDCRSNMANSWILAARHFGMRIVLAGPERYAPGGMIDEVLEGDRDSVDYVFTTDPAEAVSEADVVYTDVFVSMGQDNEREERLEQMKPYCVTGPLFALAKPEAVFMHCLPAHLGEEVTEEVYRHERSLVIGQAHNRLPVQKAILTLLDEKRKNGVS